MNAQPFNTQIRTQDIEKSAEEAANFLKMLANPKRMIILCMLCSGELSVNAINSNLKLSQSALSQHLGILRKANLVDTRRDSQTIYYRLKGDKTTRTMLLLQDMFCPS